MRATRKIVHIDPDKCDGCGQCVPSCAEGAIRLVAGKAQLVADKLCDGLGACLGHCPRGAIRVEERLAEGFDPSAVAAHGGTAAGHAAVSFAPVAPQQAHTPRMAPAAEPALTGGCPGSRLRMFSPRLASAGERPAPASGHPAPVPAQSPAERHSQLRQWPIQLTLLPEQGRIWENADLLLAADCVPFAFPEFHERLLGGRTLAIACPKLDAAQAYIDKLARVFARGSVRSVMVARMEVPCCGGLVRIAQLALQQAGRTDIPLHTVVVGIEGNLIPA